MNLIRKIKELVTGLLQFTTGLGFYGIGLLLIAIVLWVFFGWSHIAAGLLGAFIFKNYEAIVASFKGIRDNI